MPVIDLNADVGESYGAWTLGDDEAVLDVVTSANVACGFHAGDPRTLLRTVTAAAERGVVVGAQVSYPDLVGFGRRDMDLAPEDVTADVLYQVGALAGIARAAGTRVAYVKPHGALYHRVARDPVTAGALAEAVLRYDPALPVLLLAGSAGLDAVRSAGLTGVAECFADRGYRPDGGLQPRGEPGAVRTDPVEVAARAVRLAAGEAVAADGSLLRLDARSMCLHGDTAGAAALARAVRDALVAASVELAPFG
ncbi:MAG: LamB/YcsF family protein [Mycobacteriales bacterium]